MSELNKGLREEILEMVNFVLDNNSYLKGKLNQKEVGSSVNRESIEKSIKEVSDKNVKEMLRKELDNCDGVRGKELGKRYGSLLFKDKVMVDMKWKSSKKK
tara:strand:- start:39 stop:341 length:303 start_codon:yes stop_codon:yes gene_type:complete